jgi:hypothetical protein
VSGGLTSCIVVWSGAAAAGLEELARAGDVGGMIAAEPARHAASALVVIGDAEFATNLYVGRLGNLETLWTKGRTSNSGESTFASTAPTSDGTLARAAGASHPVAPGAEEAARGDSRASRLLKENGRSSRMIRFWFVSAAFFGPFVGE